MRIEHQELVHLVTQHYYVNGVEKMDDLSPKDQRQIAIAVLKDHDHFDSCDILLYDADPAKNMIAVLEAHWGGKITAEEVVNSIYDIIIKAEKSEIDTIFEEFATHQYWENMTHREREKQRHINNMDAMYGFI